MPNDAFGQHLATSERFADEVDQCSLWDEAEKYYANILWPLGSIITKKIEEVQKLNIPIKVIAPSHGVIWRNDPMQIVKKYISWAKDETFPRIVIAYESMWGATEKMSRAITEGIESVGVSVKLFDVASSDRTEIIKDMLGAKGFIFGSSTHDNGMLPSMAGFLDFVKGLRPRNRIVQAFGSFGWAGGAVKHMEQVIKEAGMELTGEGLQIKYMPDQNDIKSCFELGKNFALKVKGGR